MAKSSTHIAVSPAIKAKLQQLAAEQTQKVVEGKATRGSDAVADYDKVTMNAMLTILIEEFESHQARSKKG